jgi:hypothetical protein
MLRRSDGCDSLSAPVLDIRRCGMTDVGARALADMLRDNTTLARLFLLPHEVSGAPAAPLLASRAAAGS